MTTFKRICIKTHHFYDPEDKSKEMTLQRGKEYITSEETDGTVVVFARYWACVPADIFSGAEQFT